MHKLNLLFSLTSFLVLLVTIERFSLTSKILLQPYNFFQLHQLIQISLLILFTVVIMFFIFYEISDSFQLFTKKKLIWLPLLFIIGVYFYSTGNGLHEMANFTFNQYCSFLKIYLSNECNELFFNDYYTGNTLYFMGGIFMILALVFTEKIHPSKTYSSKDIPLTIVNAIIYAFAIFAYAAFDPVLVGLIYSLIITIVADVLFILIQKQYLRYPVIFYTALTYSLGTIAVLIVRFH